MKDSEVWANKSLTNLLEDIHNTALVKREKISNIIDALQGFMTGADDAAVIAPIIKDYFDVLNRSDEHIVKVATIVQRSIASDKGTGDGDFHMLSDEDMQLLQQEVRSELKDVSIALPSLPAAQEVLSSASGSTAP